jgi:hypothetical protein
MELMTKQGFAIKRTWKSGGKSEIRLRPSRGSDGWSIWKTRRNAEGSIYARMDSPYTEEVIPVTLRLELRQELDTVTTDEQEEENQ